MPIWEYCAVVGISTAQRHLHPSYPAVWYFTANGVRIVEIKGIEHTEVARTIAQLGQEGWEMAGCGNLTSFTHTIYFKRPK